MKKIIALCVILNLTACTFAPKLTLEEQTCPGELIGQLEELTFVVQKALLVCDTLGDFKK